MQDEEGFLTAYEFMTEDERKAFWKRENARANISYINSLHSYVATDKQIISNTQQWLRTSVEEFKADRLDEDTLRDRLTLGAEIIQGCETSIGKTKAEIAMVTRYPLYSEKRRQYLNSKEGEAWSRKNQLKKS